MYYDFIKFKNKLNNVHVQLINKTNYKPRFFSLKRYQLWKNSPAGIKQIKYLKDNKLVEVNFLT